MRNTAELAAFIHFGMNTYYDRESGEMGKKIPYYFYPEHLDTDRWIKTLKDAGFKRMFVQKHHDGFLLYPSNTPTYTIAKSGWKDGKVMSLAGVSASASKYDMDMGVYLGINSPLYHGLQRDQYNEYYLNQLKEIP